MHEVGVVENVAVDHSEVNVYLKLHWDFDRCHEGGVMAIAFFSKVDFPHLV